MRNAVGFTKQRDIEPWPSDFKNAKKLEGFDEWKEPLQDLHEYVELEVSPGLWFYILHYPDFEGNPCGSEWSEVSNDEITVLNPNIVSVINFQERKLGIYIAHGYWNAFFSALKQSAVYLLYTKYALELGYHSPIEVSNIDKKVVAAQSFLADQIGLSLSREEIVDNTKAEYTPVDMNEEIPWNPDSTGNEKPLYKTGWTKEEVYKARKEVKRIRREQKDYYDS